MELGFFWGLRLLIQEFVRDNKDVFNIKEF